MLNAIGLLKAELKQQAEQDSKVNSHLNFLSKSTMRIQSILETLKKVKKLNLKEYTPGVWMINLNSDQPQEIKINRIKINNKNTVLVVNKNLEDKIVIENELKKMGLEIVNASDLKEAEVIIDKMIHKIQAVLLSANLPANELESTLFELNNRNGTIPIILIRNADTSPESLKLMDSTAFQIINKPINSKALQYAITNSVIVAN
jgi:CheY-like chemotaxis protein